MLLILLMFICQDQSDGDWVMVEPPRIGARVMMPVLPTFTEQKIQPVRDLDEIIVRTRSAILPSGKENMTFVYHDEHLIPTSRRQIKSVLDGAVTGAIALVNGEMIRQNEIYLKNFKGRDFVYDCKIDDAKLQTSHRLRIRTRVILVRNRLFSMNYIAEADAYQDKTADQFFDSFELVNKGDDLPPQPRPGRAAALAREASQ